MVPYTLLVYYKSGGIGPLASINLNQNYYYEFVAEDYSLVLFFLDIICTNLDSYEWLAITIVRQLILPVAVRPTQKLLSKYKSTPT